MRPLTSSLFFSKTGAYGNDIKPGVRNLVVRRNGRTMISGAQADAMMPINVLRGKQRDQASASPQAASALIKAAPVVPMEPATMPTRP